MTLAQRFEQNGILYHPRSQWAAGFAPTVSPAAWAPMSKGSIIHWNGPAMGNYTPLQVPELIRATWKFHTGPSRGWLDIAYNFAIDRFGEVWEGRGDFTWNAASGENYANTEYLAFEIMIGVGDPIPPSLQNTLAGIYRSIYQNRGANFMTYHRFVTPTECPGDEIIRIIENIPNLAQVPSVPEYIGDSDTMHHYAYIQGTQSYLACYSGHYFPMSLAELNLARQLNIPMITLTEQELAELRQAGR